MVTLYPQSKAKSDECLSLAQSVQDLSQGNSANHRGDRACHPNKPNQDRHVSCLSGDSISQIELRLSNRLHTTKVVLVT